ncbi:COGs COG0500 [hydrothermal vent metagenome]|uniref:COGs COG0500 n=1 Tax=hydrothermal vent metagenome TaxID=652676 RepID=A0A3B0VWP3_9ZZZZ
MVRNIYDVVQVVMPFLSKWPRIVLALAIQLLALGVLALGVSVAPYFFSPPYSFAVLVFIQALLAVLLSRWMGLPTWWLLIQFLLPIGLYIGIAIEFNPLWALLLFGVLWLLFRNAITERVPLYLTNQTTRQALKKAAKELSRTQANIHFMDLGCGLGGNVVFMSQQRGVAVSHGVETAPIPYAFSKLYSKIGGGRIFAQDIWKTDLSGYHLVYAFLSPEPMEKLWQKVKKEMPKGSIFMSNSFAVPDVTPTDIWQLPDSRETVLYLYRL